jgi:hypothetical protein
MTINDGIRFVYANQMSDEFGVGIASSFGSTSRSGNSENRNMLTSKNNFSNHFNIHGITYDNPVVFDLIIYNLDNTYIDAEKERMLKKWLLKNNYNWLQIDQDNLGGIEYFCIGQTIDLIDVGTYSGGLRCQFLCDSPWAWSDLKKKIYTTVSNTLSFSLNTSLDFDEYLVSPTLQIKALGNGNIKIQNITTNETIEVLNCITNEQIIIECSSDKVSSTNTSIINRWNKNTISITEGKNDFLLTGNFAVTISYRLPIRVGA